MRFSSAFRLPVTYCSINSSISRRLFMRFSFFPEFAEENFLQALQAFVLLVFCIVSIRVTVAVGDLLHAFTVHVKVAEDGSAGFADCRQGKMHGAVLIFTLKGFPGIRIDELIGIP